MNSNHSLPVAHQHGIEWPEDVERFERMARFVRRLLDMPVVSLDLQDVGETAPPEPCGSHLLEWARRQTEPTFVVDAVVHPDLAADPCVRGEQGLRAVGCWPLLDDQGQRVGSLLVADRVQRRLNDSEVELLGDLARCVEAEVTTHKLAHFDGLTGLRNRRGLERSGAQLLELHRRHGHGISLLSFDLDGFKAINDVYGHAEGDRALVRFARMLKDCFRSSDLIARLGGDEFVALVPHSDRRIAAEVIERLRHAASKLARSQQAPYEIRFSVGLASFDPNQHADLSDLLVTGDRAMYAAKRSRSKEGIAADHSEGSQPPRPLAATRIS